MTTLTSRTDPAQSVVDALNDLQHVLSRLNGYEFEQVQDTLTSAIGNLIDFIEEQR